MHTYAIHSYAIHAWMHTKTNIHFEQLRHIYMHYSVVNTVHCILSYPNLYLDYPILFESSFIWTDQSLLFTMNFIIVLQDLVVCSWISCQSSLCQWNIFIYAFTNAKSTQVVPITILAFRTISLNQTFLLSERIFIHCCPQGFR